MVMGLFQTMNLMPSSTLMAEPEQMAQDELLLGIAADAGRPTFRSYSWDGVAVSFGYFQSLATIKKSFSNHALVRRWTGGGAALHGDCYELTYALAVPASWSFSKLPASETYRAIHQYVAHALQAVGVSGRMTLEADGSTAPGLACFQNPVMGDILLGETDAKVAGASQRRTREGLLIQGSIRLPQDIPIELEMALAEALGSELIPVPSSSSREIADLVDSKYGRSDWLARKP